MANELEAMTAQALMTVPKIAPAELYRRLQEEQELLVLDVRDLSKGMKADMIPGTLNISLGSLTYRASLSVPEEWREPRLQDRSRPIITVCQHGPMAALAGKLLVTMGYTDIRFLDGGMQAWKDAGLPTK